MPTDKIFWRFLCQFFYILLVEVFFISGSLPVSASASGIRRGDFKEIDFVYFMYHPSGWDIKYKT